MLFIVRPSLRAPAKQSSAAMTDALLWIASLALAMTSEMAGIAVKLAPMASSGYTACRLHAGRSIQG
jgi:hypothetical protein